MWLSYLRKIIQQIFSRIYFSSPYCRICHSLINSPYPATIYLAFHRSTSEHSFDFSNDPFSLDEFRIRCRSAGLHTRESMLVAQEQRWRNCWASASLKLHSVGLLAKIEFRIRKKPLNQHNLCPWASRGINRGISVALSVNFGGTLFSI